MESHREFECPLDLIVDLVNHIYCFGNYAKNVEPLVADQFAVARKAAESGPWWRLFYSAGLHVAMNQVNRRGSDLLVNCVGYHAELTLDEIASYLPRITEVWALLARWRDPAKPEEVRKREVLALFSVEVQRFLDCLGPSPLPSQFYEDLGRPRGQFGSFFRYLDRCPLIGDDQDTVTFMQALEYWAWLDNVIALRTFLREEGVKNHRHKRMQQAVQFYRLVKMIQDRSGVKLCTILIVIGDDLAPYFASVDLAHLAALVDSHPISPLSGQDADVFVRYGSLGEAIRAFAALD